MAVSLNDVTSVAIRGGTPAFEWRITVNDTMANSKNFGYTSFWSPLSMELRVGDFVKVTCNDGKWLGVVAGVDPQTGGGGSVTIGIEAASVTTF